MTIRINGYPWSLTTEHTASHYQLGVVTHNNSDVPYGPDNQLPKHPRAMAIFGPTIQNIDYTAGDLIWGWAQRRLWSTAELSLIRRFLSQSPNHARYALPDDLELRQLQAQAEFKLLMGDTTQGVDKKYWLAGRERVAAMLVAATNGKIRIADTPDYSTITIESNA
jgi:hypothetical protein